MSAPHAFPASVISTKAHAVSLLLTDAGLIAEPWEAVEIDEACPVEVVAVPQRGEAKLEVRPYRDMMKRMRARFHTN